MAAPMGTWNFFTSGAGTPGTLTLSTGSSGTLTGTLQTGTGAALPITAIWDDTSQILSFSRATTGGTGANDAGFTVEVYTGTLFPAYATPNGLVSGEGVPLMLAGDFGTGVAGGTVGPFNKAGWFATNTVKFKEKEGKEHKDAKDVKDKDHKDFKDKEQRDKISLEKLPEVEQSRSGQQMKASGAQDDPTAEVIIATGRSFIPEEERPEVGGSALQN